MRSIWILLKEVVICSIFWLALPQPSMGQIIQKIDRSKQKTEKPKSEKPKQTTSSTNQTKSTTTSNGQSKPDASSSGSKRKATTSNRTSSFISASPNYVQFSENGETKTISISTNASSWNISEIPSWCSSYDKTATSIKLRVGENPSTSDRTGSVVLLTSTGKSTRIDIRQSGKKANPTAQIESITIDQNQSLDDGKGMIIHVKFTVQNMKGKKGLVVAYFYNNEGKALVDVNGQYGTSGNPSHVSVANSITPGYDNTSYSDLKLSIPYSELHQTGSISRTLQFKIGMWDMSVTPNKEFYIGSSWTSFTYTPEVEAFLSVNGSSLNKTVQFSGVGGSESFNVKTSTSTYELWGIPSWCHIENRTSTGFTLVCNRNTGTSSRSDFMKVKAAGKEIRIDIKQNAGYVSTPSYTSNTQSTSTYRRRRRPFNSPYGDHNVAGFSFGYVQKQWHIEENGDVGDFGFWDETKCMHGFQCGLRIEPLFKYGFGLNTGLFYEYYYSKSEPQMYNGISYRGILQEHALYIPLHLEYRLNFSRKFQMFFYGGVGADFGLRAKLTTDQDDLTYENDNAYKGSSWKRVNASYEYGGGICISHVQFNFSMSRGLINMSDNDGVILKQNKNFMTSISFMF